MAGFRKDKTGAAQTAANAAAQLVSAFAGSFDAFGDAVEAYNELREDIFKDLAKTVDADNEMFAEAEKGGGGSRSSSRRERTSKREGKTGSRGRKSSGGGKSSISLDDALNMELNFGAFEGVTLGELLDKDAEECDEEFAYGDGERDGTDYLAWLASDKNKNEFVQRRARIIADEEGIDYE